MDISNYRRRFHIPKQPNGCDWIYLCGHSLGLQPIAVRDYIKEELEAWAKLGVEGHFQERILG